MTRILLDSHALVWYLQGNSLCSLAARAAIDATGVGVLVSAVSAWEIATKVRIGKWSEAEMIVAEFDLALERNGFLPLALTIRHGRLAGSLAGAHQDPFDRMLAAQAIVEDVPLVTADPAFRHFDVRVLW